MKNAINQTIISNATAQQACAVWGCMMETIAGSSISHQSPTKSPPLSVFLSAYLTGCKEPESNSDDID